MIARYRSVCPCGRRINPGDVIAVRTVNFRKYTYCAKCAAQQGA